MPACTPFFYQVIFLSGSPAEARFESHTCQASGTLEWLPPQAACPEFVLAAPASGEGQPPRNGCLENRQRRKATQGRARLLQICNNRENAAFSDISCLPEDPTEPCLICTHER